MSDAQPLPQDHPMLIAWELYKLTDEYANSVKWAREPQHTEGSMWASFMEGWQSFPSEAQREGYRADLAASPPGADNAQVAPAEPAEGEAAIWLEFNNRDGFIGLRRWTKDKAQAERWMAEPDAGRFESYYATPDREAATREAVIEALRSIVKCDDDAKAARDLPGAGLNGLGLTDMFDLVDHPFGAGEHKQYACRSVELEVALEDARRALAQQAKPQQDRP